MTHPNQLYPENPDHELVSSEKSSGERRINFDENLQMEWSSWKAADFDSMISKRLADTSVSDQVVDQVASVLEESVGKSLRSEVIREMIVMAELLTILAGNPNVETNENICRQYQWLSNPHSRASLKFGSLESSLTMPIPKMRIVLMVVGTR